MNYDDNSFKQLVIRIVENQEIPRNKALAVLYRILNVLFKENALYSGDNPYEEMLEMHDDTEKQ